MECTGICTGCKHTNSKTLWSFDTTTKCVKIRRGTPCLYCYVNTSRKHGYRAKNVIEKDKYDGWVLRLREETLARLNEMGGLRMFSFGDYLRTHRREIVKFLDDCQKIRLRVKAITKIHQFVVDFHDHPAINVINVSVDNLKETRRRSPISLKLAKKLAKTYNRVEVRAVALSDKDLELYGADPAVAVITLNHGNNGFKKFSAEEKAEAIKKYPKRICCENVICDGCKTLCGIMEK